MNDRRRWMAWIAGCAIVLGLTACGSAGVNGNEAAGGNPPVAESPVMASVMPSEAPVAAPTNASEPASAAPAQAAESRPDALTKQRIAMLERALGEKTPGAAANAWAEARQTRNGAMEYALLDPGTREKQRKTFEELNWVTGVSSPWIAQYRIGDGVKQADGSYRFPVQFDYRTSADADKPVDWGKIKPTYVTVAQGKDGDEFWYVTKVE